MSDISLELYESVVKRLKSCTRIQSLAFALLGLGRMWQVFLDWTEQESIPYLLCSPRDYREPFRNAMDLLWEQVKNEQIYNEHEDVFDALYDFVENSYDEEDALDVDFGNVCSFTSELISGGIAGFFPLSPERQKQSPWNDPDFYESCAASFATIYEETLSGYLYDKYYEQVQGKEAGDTIDEMVAKDPLWIAEKERIESDLALVRNYPANKAEVEQRLNEYKMLRMAPFCAD